MNRLAGIFLVFLLVGGFVLYRRGVLNTKSERDATAADTRKCVAHLQAIELSIAATLMDNENIDIATAISEIAKKNRYAFFRCQSSANDWVRINPDVQKWQHGNKSTNEVSLYCPHPGRRDVWNARNFAGDDIILSNRLAWLPVPVWELEQKSKLNASRSAR